jgi:hypothetical protein
VLAAVANVPRDNQLGVGINRRPRPNVASGFWGAFGKLDVLLLGVAERPDFVRLYGLGRNAANRFVMEGRASQPGVNQQLGNRVDAYPMKSTYPLKLGTLQRRVAVGTTKLI